MGEPRHFSTLILKLTAFCNLNCSYCYMFNLADRTYTRVPKHMPAGLAITSLSRLAGHARAAGSDQLKLILHGGEPTLWPAPSFEQLFGEVRRLRGGGLAVDVSLQTNGLLLERGLVELLKAHDVSLGFSLDGPREENDLFRVAHDGRGSYDAVIRTMDRTIGWYDPRRVGVLTVTNPAIDPAAYLAWAARLPTSNVSLLWPIEFSWINPPWSGGSEAEYAASPRYGSWMASAFRLWWDGYAGRLYIRQFVETIARMMGSRSHSDSIGNDAVDMLIVNTDGRVEYPDYLRAHRDEGAASPFRITDSTLDEVRTDPTFRSLLALRDHLPDECRACPEHDVCGGGFLAGRAGESGFDARRRSVLCHDQFFYFQSVRETIAPYLRAMES